MTTNTRIIANTEIGNLFRNMQKNHGCNDSLQRQSDNDIFEEIQKKLNRKIQWSEIYQWVNQ